MQIQDVIFLVIILNTHAAVYNRHIKEKGNLDEFKANNVEDIRENRTKINILVDTGNKLEGNNAYAKGIKRDLNKLTQQWTNKDKAENDERVIENGERMLHADDAKSNGGDIISKSEKLTQVATSKPYRGLNGRKSAVDETQQNKDTLKHSRIKREDDDVPWIWSGCPDRQHYEVTDGYLRCVKDHGGPCVIILDDRSNFGSLDCPSNTKRFRLGNKTVCLLNRRG